MAVEEVREGPTADTSVDALREGAAAALSNWATLAKKTVLASRDCGKWLQLLKDQTPVGEWAGELRKLGIKDATDTRFRTLYNLQQKLRVSDADLEQLGLVKGLDYLKELEETPEEKALREAREKAAAAEKVAAVVETVEEDEEEDIEDDEEQDIEEEDIEETEEEDTPEVEPSKEIGQIADLLEVLHSETAWSNQDGEEIGKVVVELNRLGDTFKSIGKAIDKHWETDDEGAWVKKSKPPVQNPKARFSEKDLTKA